MKKIYSLIKATLTSDMNLFKIKAQKGNKQSNLIILIFISLCFMMSIGVYANSFLELIAPIHLQYIVLSIFVFLFSIMTIVEGIYKSGPLIFNSKDDDLLLALPIKKSTILFVRIFKFYVFELFFNSLFIIPLIIAYVRWADTLNWTFFLTSIVMIFTLPIIPIIISCIIGAILSSLSSRFKYKNLTQIVLSMIFLLLILYLSFNMDGIFDYIIQNATSVNDLIKKIYYPAGLYSELSLKFSVSDLLVFILINILLFAIFILILSKFYFKINSRLKEVTTISKVNINNLTIKRNSINKSLIKKELNTFFKTPVFIINAGFGLVLYVIASIIICIKYNEIISILIDSNTFGISKILITSNLSIFILMLILATSFTTSITSSVISLEGRNINILKSLPIKIKDILMSKIYSSLILTTPILFIGDIILFIRFKINIIECILLLILSILIPLVSHFIGLIINLKYPKLDAENSTEIVKQSISSFVSVMIGIILIMINVFIITKVISLLSSLVLLLIETIIYIIIDSILYLILTSKGVDYFNNLTI